MSAAWSRLVSAFVRPASPVGGLDGVDPAVGALESGAEARPWVPPVAPVAGDAAPAPARRGRRHAAARVPEPCAFAVLAPGPAARALGAAAALSGGAGAALVACWGVAGSPGGAAAPVSRTARRLAASLTDRGFAVRAAGRLVELRLPDDEDEAIDALHRAESAAAAAGAVSVVVLAAPRGDAWDGVLATRDAVLLHGGDATVLELAAERLTGIGAPAHRLERAPSRLALTFAVAGVTPWGGAGPVRAALEAPG
ncbi:hypothetical protein [Capillimicrobium parvum]|uniref:Uncharacterized protein n=1 Tax=Capillimicrobium parvum TaxID=2884022 RepID=A0A9E6XVF5_9ACTN|nr:hypothetical protein [Capillimicrobium parvum]UGS35195.1 hypothetical protein DSM104329_01580 [Capillimicrobium parvum]